MSETYLQCGRCGEFDVYNAPPDFVSYCPECGVVEGITRTYVEVDHEEEEYDIRATHIEIKHIIRMYPIIVRVE